MEIKVKITGMHCSSCVRRIEKKLEKIGAKTKVNLVTEIATIQLKNDLSKETIISEIEKLGYSAQILDENSLNHFLDTNKFQEKNSQLNQKTQNTKENNKYITGEKIKISYDDITNDYLNASFEKIIEKSKKPSKNNQKIKLIFSILIAILTVGILIPLQQYIGNITIYFIALFSCISAFWCASTFHKTAYFCIKRGQINMDTLVSISILSSIIWSLIQLFIFNIQTLHNHFYLNITTLHSNQTILHFDTAIMITAFILLGRYIEDKAKNKGKQSIKNILNLQAKQTILITDDGKEKTIPANKIRKNDILLIKNGETIPADAIIIEGESEIDTSNMTGESIPKHVKIGDEIIGGTINTYGVLKIKVLKAGNNTMLAQIIENVLEIQNQKPQIQRLTDKIAFYFTPIIVFISILTFTGWAYYESNINIAISNAIAILVTACPCAMGLATPIALAVSTGNFIKNGILIRNLSFLENTKNISKMIFDKTGTLTYGVLKINKIETINQISEKELIKYAFILEQGVKHPISEALTSYLKEKNLLTEILDEKVNSKLFEKKIHTGYGIENKINDNTFYIGKIDWLQNLGCKIPEKLSRMIAQEQYIGSTVVIVAKDNGKIPNNEIDALGFISFTDEIKNNSKKTIKFLRKKNIEPILVTGDNFRNATHIASKVDIDENNIYANTTPIGKKQIVQQFQTREYIAMIGDGVNDCVALSQTSLKGISFSFAQGSDIAVYSSDITLLNSDIFLVAKTFKLAEKTRKIIKENLYWAFIYNIIAIPMSAFGFTNPSLAAIAMSLSSIIVVINSLRLRKIN